MIREKLDRNSGAILFKKDPDTLKYEDIVKKLAELEERLDKLEKPAKSKNKSK